MVAGQNDEAAGGFGDDVVEVEGERAHHDAADEDAEVGDSGATGQRDEVAEGHADRGPEGLGLVDGAADGEEFFSDGSAASGEVHVVEGLDVVDDATDLERDAGRRDEASGGGVDQLVLIAGGVEVAEHDEFDAAGLPMSLQGFEGFGVFGLDAEFAGFGSGGVHHGVHAGEDAFGKMLHQLGILVDQRLAFGAVGDEELDAGLRLDVGREAGPSGAHHAAFAQAVAEHKLEDSRVANGT